MTSQTKLFSSLLINPKFLLTFINVSQTSPLFIFAYEANPITTTTTTTTAICITLYGAMSTLQPHTTDCERKVNFAEMTQGHHHLWQYRLKVNILIRSVDNTAPRPSPSIPSLSSSLFTLSTFSLFVCWLTQYILFPDILRITTTNVNIEICFY